MAAEFFLNFLEQFNFWLWMLFWIAIFLALVLSPTEKKPYFIVLICGFLLIVFFIPNFYVSMALIFVWLLLLRLQFFASRWMLIGFISLLLFLDLGNPFFYIIIFALWFIMVWNFLTGSFALLDPKPEA
ncbi:MAG: hypothetical protein COT90_01495 [Candidatus Diapherotrites archaeon CG10_big_fil_rev_8_21_14_0_10_31_34]|nr:MAG: hypothetical protein COT90_01495 [Candidatus Diapherotrites archaeon CG10_big_fil_rev_8_21_14_0_10_31_34]